MKNIHGSFREIAVLQAATEMIFASVDQETVLHQILLIVRNYMGASNCSVFLLDPAAGDLYCRAELGYPAATGKPLRFRVGQDGVIGWVAHTSSPMYVPDVSQEPRYISADPKVKCELALPLMVREEVIGVLDVESDQLDYFADDVIGLLALFAGQAAVALENARLYSTERRRMRQIELINLIARSGTTAGEMDQFMGTLADLIFDTFEGVEVCLLLRDREGRLTLRAQAGTKTPLVERFAASERSGIIAEAFAARTNAVANDLGGRKNWPACLPDTGSELCVPLVTFGETLGVVLLAHKQPGFFGDDDRAIAQAAADVCATAIKNVQLAEELRRVTNTDSLTGVYNQRYFHAAVAQEISRSRRYNKQFALAMLDLRDFQHINTALGFTGGDEVLREAAQLLRSQLRSMDVLCRYSGDRFAMVLPETDPARMGTVVGKIRENLSRVCVPFPDDPRPLAAACAAVHFPQDAATGLDMARLLLARVEQAKKS